MQTIIVIVALWIVMRVLGQYMNDDHVVFVMSIIVLPITVFALAGWESIMAWKNRRGKK